MMAPAEGKDELLALSRSIDARLHKIIGRRVGFVMFVFPGDLDPETQILGNIAKADILPSLKYFIFNAEDR